MESSSTYTQAIDFVIPWVDGSDEAWVQQKAAYSGEASSAEQGLQSDDRIRYEDWGLLHFWFRGVEKFAPWVNKIHFVTWGHVPSWLDVDHPKINIVRHEDYLPEAYRPTFSANPIELNLHRIEGLAEQFVYFNDDMFLISETRPNDFFKKGLPRAMATLVPFRVNKGDWFYSPLNNVAIINDHFSPRKSIRSNLRKWFNPLYGANNFINALMLPFPAFYGFQEHHLPNSFLKSTYETVWEREFEILDATSRNRFRSPMDVTQWLMENWQFASGDFEPRSAKIGRAFFLNDDERILSEACDYIAAQKGKIICVNDGPMSAASLVRAKERVNAAFSAILPNRSSYELDPSSIETTIE